MNTIIKTGLAAILLLANSCTKEKITGPSSTAQSTDKTLTFTIGQRYGGGIIFYIDGTGQHGLIADTVDLPASTWWNGAFTTTGATEASIGKGKSNTHKIILSQGKPGKYAARRCGNYKGSGYTDWFLPSKDELNELYKQKDVVGGFVGGYYWSSTEGNTDSAWCQDFYNGKQVDSAKNFTNYVRAGRKF